MQITIRGFNILNNLSKVNVCIRIDPSTNVSQIYRWKAPSGQIFRSSFNHKNFMHTTCTLHLPSAQWDQNTVTWSSSLWPTVIFFTIKMKQVNFSCLINRWNTKLTAHNWQKWKRVFITCPCHKIYRVEAVGLQSCNYTWKIMIFANVWNLGQFQEKLIFCQELLNWSSNLKILLHYYVTHITVIISRIPYFVSA